MRITRFLSSALLVTTVLGLLPGGAAAAGRSFQDIADPEIAEAAEILRLLGVVDGAGNGNFRPDATLTRAEFCKLAVEVMGRGDDEPAQRSRTIFLDVGPSHWARGYVNLATAITLSGTGEGSETAKDRLMMGVGNGRFEPDRAITFGEAVAILTRLLGYNNSDAATGAHWYDGYLEIASASGLMDGLSLSGGDNISRGQAALLFKNLLFAGMKGSSDGEETYLKSVLNGSVSEDVIILAIDEPKTGTSTVIQTSDNGSYKTDRTSFPDTLIGVRGDLVLDGDKKVLTILPEETDTIRRVSVLGQAEANQVPIAGGGALLIEEDTIVWKNDENGSTSSMAYKDVWTDLYTGTPMVFCYGSDGKIAYIFLPSSSASSDNVMVARSKYNGIFNPFSALIGGDTGYQIYKNGVLAGVEDICQYDVATYDSGSKILNVSDLRLTGLYENASPNPTAPSRITVLGVDFKVLPGAIRDLSAFRPGKEITLLLTNRGEVAGAVDPAVLKSTVVGVVESVGGGTATVKPLTTLYDADGEEIIFKGASSLGESASEKMTGQLVRVSAAKAGQLNLSRIGNSGTSRDLDVAARALGSAKLTENVAMFERVGNSIPQRITFDQLTCDTVPASKILYVNTDSAGNISTIVFQDVTGDQYLYGFAESSVGDYGSGQKATVKVKYGNGSTSDTLICTSAFRYNQPIGIAKSMEKMDGYNKLAGAVVLTESNRISRMSFDMDAKTVLINETVFPISEQVRSYNRTTGYWFEDGMEGVQAARAYAETMTVYYDKEPQDGGKIRLIVVS